MKQLENKLYFWVAIDGGEGGYLIALCCGGPIRRQSPLMLSCSYRRATTPTACPLSLASVSSSKSCFANRRFMTLVPNDNQAAWWSDLIGSSSSLLSGY